VAVAVFYGAGYMKTFGIWLDIKFKNLICKALFDCDYKLDCWPDCSQIVARLFTICLCDLM
jgi:hypothetical protein